VDSARPAPSPGSAVGTAVGHAARAARRADIAVLVALRTRGHHPGVERAVARYSDSGDHSMLWLSACTAGVAAHRGRRSVYVRCGRAVVAAEILNATAKAVVGRRRPALAHLPGLAATRSQLSHPSAHATTSFAAATVLAEALPAGLTFALAGGMALSRPYLGVHYPSDIVVGAAFGFLLARALG
jgi:membrane-associated phospholipid phosphatase